MRSKIPIRLIIADDHAIFRDGFKVLLKDQQEVKLIGEASDGKELMKIVAAQLPDVVVTDIKMPHIDGITACKYIKKDFPDIQVIALSMFNDDHLVVDMLEAGASGYLLKNTNKFELLDAVTAVYNGETYYSEATSRKLAKLIGKSKFTAEAVASIKLSDREIQVLRHICDQLSTKEIAATMNLSHRTVESHREHIQQKTRSKNLVGVVIYAIKNGLYELKD